MKTNPLMQTFAYFTTTYYWRITVAKTTIGIKWLQKTDGEQVSYCTDYDIEGAKHNDIRTIML